MKTEAEERVKAIGAGAVEDAVSAVTDAEAVADRRRRTYLLKVILIGSIGALIAIDFSILYYSFTEGSAYGGVSFAEFSILPAFFIFLYALARHGFVRLSSWLLIAGYAAGVGYAAYKWGADLETTVLSLVLIGVIASILLGARTGFLAAAVAGAAAIPLWYAQWRNVNPAFNESLHNYVIVVIVAGTYMLVFIAAWRGNRTTERSLAQALRAEADLKERLRRSELEKIGELYKFAELGRLSSGIFHDILNVMNGLALESEVAARSGAEEASRGGDGAVAREKFKAALRASERIGNFAEAIRRQLASGMTSGKFSLPAAIKQAIGLLQYEAKIAGVGIVLDYDTRDGLTYSGNDFKFHQVAMNLISNAIESGGKHVVVGVLRSGDDFVVTVGDDGGGIPPEVRARIFEPFFTTKSASGQKAGGSPVKERASRGGMGLGLAIVKRIVEEDLAGTIAVVSREGKGTTFTVRFPCVQKPSAPSEGIEPPSRP